MVYAGVFTAEELQAIINACKERRERIRGQHLVEEDTLADVVKKAEEELKFGGY